jgi:ribonuclease HII
VQQAKTLRKKKRRKTFHALGAKLQHLTARFVGSLKDRERAQQQRISKKVRELGALNKTWSHGMNKAHTVLRERLEVINTAFARVQQGLLKAKRQRGAASAASAVAKKHIDNMLQATQTMHANMDAQVQQLASRSFSVV